MPTRGRARALAFVDGGVRVMFARVPRRRVCEMRRPAPFGAVARQQLGRPRSQFAC